MEYEDSLLIKKSNDTNGYIIFDCADGSWVDRIFSSGTNIKRYTRSVTEPTSIVESNISPEDMDVRLLETIRGSAGRSANRGEENPPRPIVEEF